LAGNNRARLYALIARRARKAVVFRRGPSKSVLLLAWDLRTDQLTAGQWLKGRIYERRCDLSPDGQLLVYFAASYRGPWLTWTAISRPPYLTALAAWPKGDAWSGGGLFSDDRSLALNHPAYEQHLAPGFALPGGFRVEPLRAEMGEDDPIWSLRHERDGWTLRSPGRYSTHDRKGSLAWRLDPPGIWDKGLGGGAALLRTNLHGIGERDGTWYVQTGQVVDGAGAVLADLGRIDWADVDHNGDVLFARQGCLFRLGYRRTNAILVADLNGLRFEPVAPPAIARSWPRSARQSQLR
jgi:hypothetical protein